MVERAGLDPTRYACGDPEHVVTRSICECPWFDGCCHECPNTDLPTCMTFWEEDDA